MKFLLKEDGDFLLLETGDKIILDTDYVISGIATLAGLPLQNAKITLIDSDTDVVVDTALTDVDGFYEFSGLDPLKMYHAAGEMDDTPDLYNALSLPFLTPIR